MTTKTTKKVVKKATKRTNTTKNVMVKHTITAKQLETVAAFYTKNDKAVPAFILKKLNA